jgi:hypothetical protein
MCKLDSKTEFHRETENVVCAGRVVHSCLQAVICVLCINIEVLVMKNLKQFYILKFVTVDIKKILQHGNARFISLLLLTVAVSNSHTEAF